MWVMRMGLPLAAAGLGLGACGGSSSPPSPGAPASAPTPDTRMIDADPSFSTTIQDVFERSSCTSSGCHGSAQAAGLDLRRGASLASLVGVPASSESFPRVAPGDPDNSYLVIKLEGRQSVGSRMPLSRAALDEIDLTNIRNWIAQGAKDN